MAQPQVLGRLPLTNLLKNDLHVSRSQLSFFFFACGLAWYFKPFAGILTDAFPLMRTRRRHYLIVSAVLAGASWGALFVVPHTYQALLIACIVINAFVVIASTVVGAILVETGQASAATGRLSSLRIFVQNFCQMVQGPLGGMLAMGAFSVAAGVNAIMVLTIVPVAYVMLRERPEAVSNTQAIGNALQQLVMIGRSKTLWWAILFLGMFYFAPGFATPLLYKQQDEFKLSMQVIGNLGSAGAIAALCSSALYAVLCKKINLRTLILVGVLANAAGNFCYLLYSPNLLKDSFIEIQNGFFFTICEISLLDLAARSVPKGCEGLGYALMLSMRNFALFGGDYVGSLMSDKLKIAFWQLIAINSGTTLFVLFLLPFLPRAVVMVKDMSQKLMRVEEAGA